jgi:hypothetical protein
MKKEYTTPVAFAITLASEGVMATSNTSIDITGTSGSSTDDKITGESGIYTNREKPGAGLWE